MRTLKKFMILLLPVVLLTSCFNDDGYSLDNYQVDIATVENPDSNNVFFLRLDDNILLWTAATNFPAYKPADGQRVVANYSVLWDKRETGLYDYDVKLNDLYVVLTKGVFNITPETQDSIGNDSIVVNEMWVGSKYLNVDFSYPGYSKTHYINLVYDQNKTYTDGKVHLEFRHNSNEDRAVYNRWGLVSFDISSLQDNARDSIEMVIHVNVPDKAEDKLYELTYHYGAGESDAVVRKGRFADPFGMDSDRKVLLK